MRLTVVLPLLAVAVTILPAVAQNRLQPVESRPLPPEMAANPDLRRVVITRAQCRELQRHEPRDDVTYKPGVDVRGKPVAPADLGGGSTLGLTDELSFDLTVRLADFLRQPPPRGISESIARLGRVAVRGNDVTFNDMPMTGPAVAEIVALCRAQVRD